MKKLLMTVCLGLFSACLLPAYARTDNGTSEKQSGSQAQSGSSSHSAPKHDSGSARTTQDENNNASEGAATPEQPGGQNGASSEADKRYGAAPQETAPFNPKGTDPSKDKKSKRP